MAKREDKRLKRSPLSWIRDTEKKEGEVEKSRSPEPQSSKRSDNKKPRRQTTVYLTKEQLRAMKEIQMELSLNNDFDIENSEIAGVGIELLREIFKNPEVQKSENLEVLKTKCLNTIKKHQES